MTDLEKKLKALNKRLKTAKIRVTVEQRGSRLCARATFPPKPDSDKLGSYQQRIPIAEANLDGLILAEAKAKEIGGLLAQNRFDWEPYLTEGKTENKIIGNLIEDLEKDYFEKRKRTPEAEHTWKNDYLQPFKLLPVDQNISESLLQKTILLTSPDTRSRQRTVLAFSRLANFAGINTDKIKSFKGNYSQKSVNPRELPSDQLIAEVRETFKNPNWQYLYSLMATYGLRNHEAFFVDVVEFPIIFVCKGKTGQRHVFPLYPEWAERWELHKIDLLPNCTGKGNLDFGMRVTQAFRRYNVPFPPYNLRHAWARRSIDFGWDLSLAARQMGHDINIHTKTYHHWITKNTYQQAFENLMNRPDRPRPPIV